MTQWHACSTKQALEELRSGAGGLTGAEAARRLVAHGPNKLAHKKDKSFPARLLGQLKDPMILVLLVAAALLGSWTVLAYLPYLVVAGAASGLFTGLCAQLLVGRLKGLDHG